MKGWFPVIVLYFLVFSLFFNFNAVSQDTLVFKDGKRIGYLNLDRYTDHIEVKSSIDKKFVPHDPDSLLGFSQTLKEQSFFIMPNPEENEKFSYVFLTKLEVGKINFYQRNNAFEFYMEKGDRFEMIYNTLEQKGQQAERFEVFSSFVEDDEESLKYITNGFNFKYKEIEKVVQYYNSRNFEHTTVAKNEVRGRVYLYRTRFQKTKKPLEIKLNGKVHDLYIDDFIQLNLPVRHASRLTIYDDNFENDILVSGGLEEHFYEVLFDAKTIGFKLDRKKGTELHFEYYKILDKVGKRIRKN